MPPLILNMPDNEFRDLEWDLPPVQAGTQSGYTGSGQVSSNPWLQRWTFSAVHVPILSEAEVLPWRVFFRTLRYRENKFRFIANDQPQHSAAVVGAVYGGGQALPRNTLRIALTPNVPGWPLAGMFMTVGNQLLAIKSSVLPGGQPANVRDVVFEAPLRIFAPDLAPVEILNPYGVFELTAPSPIRGPSADGQYSFAIQAQEYFVRP